MMDLPLRPVGGEWSGLLVLANELGNGELLSQLNQDESAIDKSNVLTSLRTKLGLQLKTKSNLRRCFFMRSILPS
jgi:hypothetical protein